MTGMFSRYFDFSVILVHYHMVIVHIVFMIRMLHIIHRKKLLIIWFFF